MYPYTLQVPTESKALHSATGLCGNSGSVPRKHTELLIQHAWKWKAVRLAIATQTKPTSSLCAQPVKPPLA